MTDGDKKDERGDVSTLSYSTPWVANGLAWSPHVESASSPIRLALTSFLHDYRNCVELIEKDDASGTLVCRASWEHCYPATKVAFPPRRLDTDVVVTTADYLRLWQLVEGAPKVDHKASLTTSKAGAAPPPAPPTQQQQQQQQQQTQTTRSNDAATMASGGSNSNNNGSSSSQRGSTINTRATLRRVFDNGKPNELCSPVTSCDWNAEDVNVIACCSINSMVTIWDVERGQQRRQVVAHDKDVFDVAFASAHTFASCGADGSLRLFDLRSLDHCTILYETQGLLPLLRVAWNQQDTNYIATFSLESCDAVVVDVRYPAVPASMLSERHTQPINGMAWSPQSAQNICTVGEDGVVCIWGANADVGESLFQYTCGTPINQVAWRQVQQQDWIAITTSDGAQLLRL